MFFVRCLLIALLLSVFGRAEAANPLDFEGLADGTVLSGQYSGLVFSNAIVLTSGISLNELEFPPHSGVNVASDNSGPMQIAFASPVQSFSAYFTYATRLQVVAFGLNSSVVATVNSLFADNLALSGDSGSSPNERIQISFAAGISSLRITGMADGASFAMDDISISAVPESGSLVMFALGALAIFRVSRRRRVAASAGAVLLCVHAASMAQAVGVPTLSPAALRIGTPTTVLVTARIKQANVIPGGVNVLRIAPTGEVIVLGSLNDAGVGGDTLAGDSVYAGRVVLNESIEGSLGIRVSVAVRGSLRRLQSQAALLAVLPAGAPLDLTVPDVSQQTTDPASGLAILANSLNACFKDTTPYSTVLAIAALVGATPGGRYSEIGNCYQLTIPSGDGAAIAAASAVLAAQSDVRYAEAEPIVSGDDSCTGPICTDPNYSTVLNLPQAHNLGQGTGVVIAILDTGLDAALIPSISFPTAILGSNFSNTGNPLIPGDDNGHGTLVAYIAQATAPSSTLFISKVLNANKKGTERTSFLGMREALAGGAQIINMSLSSRFQSLLMRDLITTVQNSGIVVVAAAGNRGSDIREYPAAHLGAVAVGNVDNRDQRATGPGASNFGSWVNIAAPGVNVAGLGLSGTSFSAPFVSGTAALLMAKFPALSRVDLISQLYRTTLPIPFIAGQDTCPLQPCNQDLGNGRLDVEAALGSIRLTRSTSVNAPAATIVRTIEVAVSSAATNAVLFSTQRSFLGQSTGCEVATVKNPPCISNVPFDFAALAPGRYLLRLSFRDPTASFFGSVQLTSPGSTFSSVVSGTGSINAADPSRGDFSLFGFGTQTAIFEMRKL